MTQRHLNRGWKSEPIADKRRRVIEQSPLRPITIRAFSCLLLALLLGATGCSSLRLPILTEKQIRQEIKTDYSVSDPEFRASISALLGAPLVDSNNIVELQNGDQIFPSMLNAIRSAKQSVTLESFIWSSGKISDQFVDALSERARAGVKVRIVVDWLGSWFLKRSDQRKLEAAGARVVRFHPLLSLQILRFNHRTHRKLMIVDGKIGFIGGVCLSDHWAGNAGHGEWRDIHFRVEGPAVAEMQAAFCGNWLETKSAVLQGPDYFPVLKPAGSMTAQCFPSGPRDHAQQARLSYLLAMSAARKNIRLAHAYFVPDKLVIQTLIDARKRGVRVEVIMPAKIDFFLIHMASRARLKKLLEVGVEFYEYKPTLYHCKIMIVDNCWTTVGSVNLDAKSFRVNDEANLNVLDTDFAATLTKTFEADKAQSRPLTLKDFKHQNPFSKIANWFVGLFEADL
jgi:cardiolipin synthase